MLKYRPLALPTHEEHMRIATPALRPVAICVAATCAAVAVLASAALAFDPTVEAQNYAKGQERQTIYDTPQYQALLTQVSEANEQEAATAQLTDPERQFQTDLCARGDNGCAGDARLYDWGPKGFGTVRTVLFTARDGATLYGHVWATKAGPAKRPGIVITNGSVQAPERLYWYAAQALAKAGYVVMTFDPQGQGLSDTQGETPDQNEGVPAQSDGRPFVDGTEDAIDFFLSTPSHPYEPRPSCSSGTSHRPKQDRRVQAGLDSANNPDWQMIDPTRLGLAGHSYGAAGVSYIGQWDPRVKTIVAWDNLAVPDPSKGINGGALEQGCVDASQRTVPPITKPALGMSADYFIPPEPNTSDPDPLAKSQASLAYTRAGVDTGELIIRGGTHYDFSWIANPAFPASLRGADMISWYTTAWFDKYLKNDCTADRRLLTDRWRNDGEEAAIDQPGHDADVFSFYYRSRLDLHLADGRRYDNEDLRSNATGLSSHDGFPGSYSYLAVDRSPDAGPTDFGSCPAPAASGTTKAGSAHRCVSRRHFSIRLHRPRGARLRSARVYVDGRRVAVVRGRRLRSRVDLRGLPSGRFTVRVVAITRGGRRVVSVRHYVTCVPRRRT